MVEEQENTRTKSSGGRYVRLRADFDFQEKREGGAPLPQKLEKEWRE